MLYGESLEGLTKQTSMDCYDLVMLPKSSLTIDMYGREPGYYYYRHRNNQIVASHPNRVKSRGEFYEVETDADRDDLNKLLSTKTQYNYKSYLTMDNLLHGTDTMTIIKRPDPKSDTTTNYTFERRNVEFRVDEGHKVHGIEYFRISRGKTNIYLYLAYGRMFYDQKTRKITIKIDLPETIPNRTWHEFYHGPNPSFAKPLPFKADWEDSVSYELAKMFNIKHNGKSDYQYQRKDKVEIVIHPSRVDTKYFRLNLVNEKAITEKAQLLVNPPRDLRFVHRPTITVDEIRFGDSDDLVIGEATGDTVTEHYPSYSPCIKKIKIDGLPYWSIRRVDDTTIYLHQSRVKEVD